MIVCYDVDICLVQYILFGNVCDLDKLTICSSYLCVIFQLGPAAVEVEPVVPDEADTEDTPPVLDREASVESVTLQVTGATPTSSRAPRKSMARSSTPTSSTSSAAPLQDAQAVADRMRQEVLRGLDDFVRRPEPSPYEAFGAYLSSVTSSLHPSCRNDWMIRVSTLYLIAIVPNNQLKLQRICCYKVLNIIND